jgi:hypothetical protein
MDKMRFLTVLAALAMSAQVAFADGLNRHVMIINDTDFTMMRFYASNKDSTSWEEDIFGDDVLPPHSQIDVNIDDGTGYCVYDFKAVFDDGEEVTAYGQNVCELPSWRVY